jgi:hypothetical protein
MKLPFTLTLTMSLMTLNPINGLASPGSSHQASSATLRFSNVEYLHRWSKNDQHEFTPREQTDLSHWNDMITINYYRRATDGDGLAAAANAVLEAYKSHRAVVVRTNSVPRTPQKPAEHLIVVLFPQPEFIEAVFARFKLEGGVGAAVIYSHRIYGNKVGEQMSAWLKANGPELEKTLMNLNKLPDMGAPKA